MATPRPSLTILCWTIVNRWDRLESKYREDIKVHFPMSFALAKLTVRGDARPTQRSYNYLKELATHLETEFEQSGWYDPTGKIDSPENWIRVRKGRKNTPSVFLTK